MQSTKIGINFPIAVIKTKKLFPFFKKIAKEGFINTAHLVCAHSKIITEHKKSASRALEIMHNALVKSATIKVEATHKVGGRHAALARELQRQYL